MKEGEKVTAPPLLACANPDPAMAGSRILALRDKSAEQHSSSKDAVPD
jgi:hypothetical protein